MAKKKTLQDLQAEQEREENELKIRNQKLKALKQQEKELARKERTHLRWLCQLPLGRTCILRLSKQRHPQECKYDLITMYRPFAIMRTVFFLRAVKKEGDGTMPCPHYRIKISTRSKGQSAVAQAAYQSGDRLFDERENRTKYYSDKRGIVYTEIMLLSKREDYIAAAMEYYGRHRERQKTRDDAR